MRARRAWPACPSGGSCSSRAFSAGRRRAWPAWSRWPPCTAAPMPRSSPATAIPASSSPSSRARTRSPSCRSRSCSAASRRAAACCSAVLDLPDATVYVLQGDGRSSLILASETLYGRSQGLSGPGRPDVGTGLGLWGVPVAVLGGAIRVSTPFLFVSLGECITERAGASTSASRASLVMGAMTGYAVSYLSGYSVARRARRRRRRACSSVCCTR